MCACAGGGERSVCLCVLDMYGRGGGTGKCVSLFEQTVGKHFLHVCRLWICMCINSGI